MTNLTCEWEYPQNHCNSIAYPQWLASMGHIGWGARGPGFEIGTRHNDFSSFSVFINPLLSLHRNRHRELQFNMNIKYLITEKIVSKSFESFYLKELVDKNIS